MGCKNYEIDSSIAIVICLLPLVLHSIIIGFYHQRKYIHFYFLERGKKLVIFRVWHRWSSRVLGAGDCVCVILASTVRRGKSRCGISTEGKVKKVKKLQIDAVKPVVP